MLLCSVLALGGCGFASGVSVPPGGDDLRRCTAENYRVEGLAAAGMPGCDLTGSSLTFPDGTTLRIEPIGVVFGHQADVPGGLEFLIVNWGVPGVGAALVEGGVVVGVWGSSAEAVELQRQQLRLDGLRASP